MSTQNTPLRRKDRLRTQEEARAIMESCDFAVLSTTDNPRTICTSASVRSPIIISTGSATPLR